MVNLCCTGGNGGAKGNKVETKRILKANDRFFNDQRQYAVSYHSIFLNLYELCCISCSCLGQLYQDFQIQYGQLCAEKSIRAVSTIG